MKQMTVTVIGKEITTASGKFTAYSVLSSKGNWYRTAKVPVDTLKEFDRKIVTIEVSRSFDKLVDTSSGTKTYPTLVIESMIHANDAEIKAYNDAMAVINDKTLENVN